MSFPRKRLHSERCCPDKKDLSAGRGVKKENRSPVYPYLSCNVIARWEKAPGRECKCPAFFPFFSEQVETVFITIGDEKGSRREGLKGNRVKNFSISASHRKGEELFCHGFPSGKIGDKDCPIDDVQTIDFFAEGSKEKPLSRNLPLSCAKKTQRNG